MFFGLVYLAVENVFQKPVCVWLTLVQIALLLLAVYPLFVINRFWWRALGNEEAATNLPFPQGAGALMGLALTASIIVFLVNILGKHPLARKP